MAHSQNVTTRRRGRPRLEDTEEIENVLLSAALEEFVQSGYEGASMRSIAKAANVARPTLQLRYASKEELFQAIMTQQIRRMSAATSLQFTGPPDLRKGLVAYANRALSYSLTGDFLEVNRLVYGCASRFPEIAAAAMESTRLGVAQISDFIRRCAEADDIPCRRPEIPAECFVLLLRGWYGYAIVAKEPEMAATREQWVEDMVDTLIAGRGGW